MQNFARMTVLVAAVVLASGVAVVAGDPDDGGHVGVGDENGEPQDCPPGPSPNPCGGGSGNGGLDEDSALCGIPNLGQNQGENEMAAFLECEGEGIGSEDGPEDDPEDPDDYYAYQDHGVLHMQNISLLCFREDSDLYQWNEIGFNGPMDTVVKIREFEETPAGGGVVEIWLNGDYHVTSTTHHGSPKTVEEIFDDLQDLISADFIVSRQDDYITILSNNRYEEVETVSMRVTDPALITSEMAIEPYDSDWNDTTCN